MARVPRLTPLFLARRRALGIVRGSPESQALGATIASLCEAATLPGVLDVLTAMPPTRTALVRRVAGQTLWVWHSVTDAGDVVLLTLTRVPPVPLSP